MKDFFLIIKASQHAGAFKWKWLRTLKLKGKVIYIYFGHALSDNLHDFC